MRNLDLELAEKAGGLNCYASMSMPSIQREHDQDEYEGEIADPSQNQKPLSDGRRHFMPIRPHVRRPFSFALDHWLTPCVPRPIVDNQTSSWSGKIAETFPEAGVRRTVLDELEDGR